LKFEIIDYFLINEFWEKLNSEKNIGSWKILTKKNDSEFIVYNKCELNCIKSNGENVWLNSIFCNGIPNSAQISNDRLIITTNSENYHSWGFLGPTYLINIENGIIIKELKGEIAKSLGDGCFILGLEGYEYFNTWEYDKNGILKNEWRSYGEYFIKSKEIYVVEDDRSNPTNGHLVKLLPNNKIVKGEKLKTSSSSNIIAINNDNFIFENNGNLKIYDLNLKKKMEIPLINYSISDSWRFFSRIWFENDNVIVQIMERSQEVPIEYKTNNWIIKIE
jgi:hypothetical protein